MSRFFSALPVCGIALAGVVLCTPAAAQFAKPEDAIKYRKSAMYVQTTHLGRLFAMANGRVPFDAKLAVENAEMVAEMSKWQFSGFVAGSDKGNTDAKPEIWTEAAKFQDAVRKSQEDVIKLNTAAKVGTLEALKAAVGPVGQSCKACHDAFRKE
jgi:cytochrome c556